MNASATPRVALEALLRAGLEAVHGGRAVERNVRVHDDGSLEIAGRQLAAGTRLRVVAVGKAASAMAEAFGAIAGDSIRRGLVVTKDGHAQAIGGFEVCEAGHPVPDERSERAAHAVLGLAASAAESDVFVLLLSGGASALLTAPVDGLTREQLAETTRILLACGADIHELNTLRKHLFAVAGGRLARACSCSRVIVLAISDVPNDDLAVIGSGPCEVDPTSFADALEVVDRHRLRARLPAAVLSQLLAGVAGRVPESAKPGDANLPEVHSRIIASNRDAVLAVCAEGARRGLRVIDLGSALCGEARDRGLQLAALARAVRVRRPTVLVASGETTVTLRGKGQGGRNQELALAAAIGLQGNNRATMLAVGTDGSDGPTEVAGAFADCNTVERGRARGVDAELHLARNDSHSFFAREGGHVCTGATSTNVMDLVLIGIELENASNSDRDEGV